MPLEEDTISMLIRHKQWFKAEYVKVSYLGYTHRSNILKLSSMTWQLFILITLVHKVAMSSHINL